MAEESNLNAELTSALANTDITIPDSPSPEQAAPPPDQTQPSAQAQTPPPTGQAPAAVTGQAVQPGQQPAPQTPTWESMRDYAARGLGFQQASQFQDDTQFTQALLATYQQQAQAIQRYNAERQQYAAALAAAQQNQQRAQQPAQQAAPEPLAMYKAPEYNPEWENLIDHLQGGGMRIREGHDPAILAKYQAHRQWSADFAKKLVSDPAAALRPLIAHEAQQIADQRMQEQFQVRETNQYVDGFINQNSSWLFAHDQQGQPFRNPATGKLVLTPHGQRFQQYLDVAQNQLGISQPQAQQQYAAAMITRDMAWPTLQQQWAQQQGQQRQQAAVAQNRPQPTGSFVGQQSPGVQASGVQNTSVSLADQLNAALTNAGISEISA